MELDFEWCYRAVESRDSRFDGWFYTAVTTTGIFCRPSCPARTPHRHNVRFYRSAAAAHGAGFRACRRCRPDAVPGSPEWDTRADVVGRAMRLLGDGVVDREGVPGLARRLGYTERHLHRLLTAEVGAGPLALARAQRAHTARTLVESTNLGLAEVAFAAGFGSVRQFNETVRLAYGVPPSTLRATANRGGTGSVAPNGSASNGVAAGGAVPAGGVLTLRLAYRAPLHAESLFSFLASRAIPGVEAYLDGAYHRALRLPHGPGQVVLHPGDGYVMTRLRLTDLRDLAPAVARCRRLLDLDADPEAVDSVLAADPALAPEIAKAPGVRVPRAVDGFEVALRAIVGQQISVASARTVLTRLCTARPYPAGGGAGSYAWPELRPVPEPAAMLELPDEAFGMPAGRREAIRALAAAVVRGDLDLEAGVDRDQTATQLLALPGIGEWTTRYIQLRGLGDPDILLHTDLGVRRGAAALGLPDQPTALAAHAADRWAPWRSYALIRLWRHA